MKIEDLSIDGIKLLTPKFWRDDRGFFVETWSRRALESVGVIADFVQDNQAFSIEAGTLRGLHYQLPPMAQLKLVRCTRGSVLDVAVDIRRASPSFGRHVSAVLSAENGAQLLVPEGFAHGYVTLEPNSEVCYKVTANYAPAQDRGILWNDPDLAIAWGLADSAVILSEKDKMQPRLRDARQLFD
ncbi:MAG: dTDP-4-dehydrorhamnose 3,5-epimerase [Hyphomicrobium sp.]